MGFRGAFVWIAVAAVLVASAGCGSEDGGSAPAAQHTAAPAARVPADLVGTYTRTIAKAQIKAVHGASLAGPPQGLPTGKETMRIIGDASVGFSFSDTGVETGTLKFMGDGGQFEITTNGFCEHGGTGLYSASLKSQVLTVHRLKDPHCPDRVVALIAKWHKTS